ncbi:MAG: MFS transporter [Novosphingobium sp.]
MSSMSPRQEVAEAPGQAAGWYRYYVILILALVYTFSSIDRTLISVLAEPIKTEFALTDGQLGLLAGLAFAISYSLAGIPLGILIDRYSRTRILSSLVTVWSALTLLCGLASSWVMLMLARIGVGASESGASPAAMSLITDYFPKEKRGLAMSLFYTSTPVAVGVSFALGGVLAAHFGWRAVFFLSGIPGFLLALLILLTIREPVRGASDTAPADPAPASDKGRAGPRAAMQTLLATPPLYLLMLAAASVVIAQAGLSAFASPFLIRVHGLTIEQAGYGIAIAKGPTGVLGILLGGVFADRMAVRSIDAAPRLVGWLMLLATPLAVGAMLVDNWMVVIALIATYNFLNYTYYGATFATFMTIAPLHMRGVLGGVLAVVLNLVGYGCGPPIAGLLSDTFTGLGVEHPIRWALVGSALFFAVGACLFFMAAKAIRVMEARRLAGTAS